MHLPWDELEAVEAVVRLGGLASAGQELGLTHSSISRRLASLERRLDLVLFGRGRRVVPTPLARALAAQCATLRQTNAELSATVARAHRARLGRLVITTNDVLSTLLFAALKSVKLEARVEVLVSDQEEALLPGVVDLALRPGHSPAPWLRGRRVGALRLGVFRAPKAAPDHWVLPSAGLRARTSMPWWREVPASAPATVEVDSLRGMYEACLAGLGAAVLPTFLTRGDPRLRYERPIAGSAPVWLLAAQGVRDQAGKQTRDAILAALRGLDAWAR